MSSSSGCLIRSDLFLLLSTTLAPPTSQRLRQVPWLKCVRKMFYVQTHTKTHTQKETASSRDIIVNDDTWNVSSKQFPAVLFLGGSGKRDYLPFSNCSIPECSSTHRKSPEHWTKETSTGVSSFLPCGWRYHILHVTEVPLTQQMKKLNISLNWTQLICPLPQVEDFLRATLSSLLGNFYQFSALNFTRGYSMHI